jgi:fatty-acyl-CoA synthase
MTTTQLSYASGAATVPFIGTTIGQQFDNTVTRWGDRLGLVSRGQDIRWSYAELAQRVEAAAAGLLALGLAPGDRVGIWSPNNAEWIITQFATAKAGLILVNINPAYRTSELEYCLKKVGCKALIFAHRFKTSDYGAMLREIAPEIDSATPGALEAKALPELRLLIQIGGADAPGQIGFDDLMNRGTEEAHARLEALSQTLQFDDPINIQFTSGTTGSPKGATLTHHNILNNGYFIGQTLRYTEADRVCVPVPLYHCFGMVIGALACLTHGAALVLPGEAFDPLATLRAIEAERCTSVYGVPTMFIAELDHPEFDRFDMSTLRTGVMAGSPCPAEVMRRCIARMNLTEMTICYGMTETSPVSMQTRIGDPLDKQVSTVGCVHPHLEVKIVDDQGCILPRGEVGEFCLRGYSVMAGYWGDAEASAAAIDAARWMHSGDLASMDADGYVTIEGRIKDMVIRGGENIYPKEVEEFFYTHPDVQEVQVFRRVR